MWVRAIKHSSALAINQPLGYYRFFENNASTTSSKQGDNLRDWVLLRDIFATKYEEFDSARFNKLLKKAAFWQAISFLNANAKVAAKQNARLWWELLSTTGKVKQVTLPVLRVDTKKLQLLRNLI